MHLTDETNFKWELEEEITDQTLIVKDGTIRQNGNIK
jgi:NAD(P) transhydrogenase subunit alpha